MKELPPPSEDRVGKSADGNTASSKMHAELFEMVGGHAKLEKNSTEKQPAKYDLNSEAEKIARTMLINNGFGKGEDRQNINSSIGKAMQKGPDKAEALVNKVNETLKAQGSELQIESSIKGGGGGGGKSGSKTTVETSESEGRFELKGGAAKDNLSINVGKETVKEGNKVVGEREWMNTPTGGGGNGWGKQAPGDLLHDVIIDGAEKNTNGSKQGDVQKPKDKQ
ncbi:MAG: hypothetical protein K2X81_20850 [Candidatus Obscuribacterales bacterium]|nr:hypothetical protein [Candidatus Obscuribacterales bacterium]